MIAQNTTSQKESLATRSAWTAQHQDECSSRDQEGQDEEARLPAPKVVKSIAEPSQFFELSQQSGLLLEGVAGANLKNTGQLIFFVDDDALQSEEYVEVPMRRIQSMEVLSESPIKNTPLDLPSLWPVRIALHPTEGIRKEKLFTVFEK